MTTYLVDYENTSHHGLEGYRKLTAEDTVVIFIGAKGGTTGIPVDVVREMTGLGQRPRLLWKRSKKTAKNYLDLQMVSYLGWCIGDPAVEETDYIIVSKDQDFLAAVDFWTERSQSGATVRLRPTIAEQSVQPDPQQPQTQPAAAQPPAQRPAAQQPAAGDAAGQVGEAVRKQVRAAVRQLALTPQHYSAIYRAMAAGGTPQQLHGELGKALGQPRGVDVYRAIKEIFDAMPR